MREYRFYSERENLRVGSSVKLPDFEATHILKSLRLKKNDEVILFNGFKEFRAILKLVSREAVMAEIIEIVADSIDKPFQIDLIQGLSKAKSFEEILEKVTEIGIKSIYPLFTEYSVVKLEEKIEGKLERWESIVISACKQSERIDIPAIQSPLTIEDIEQVLNEYDHILLFTTEEQERTPLIDVLNIIKTYDGGKVALIVGTEGGFSKTEIEKFKSIKNLKLVKLTDSVLRSETAAILACGSTTLFLNS